MKGGKVITETIGVMDFTDKQVAAIVTINETEYAFDNLTGKMLTDRIVKKDVVRGKYEYIEDRDLCQCRWKGSDNKRLDSNEERLYLCSVKWNTLHWGTYD